MSDAQRDALPLPDYDHHTTGSLQAHVQGLELTELEALVAYEREHGARVPMLTILERRMDALRHGEEPTTNTQPPAPGPETAEGAGRGSRVDPATSGPPINPPSHGVPTNPAQPRT